MGFGNVASENILFIAAVVVATGLVGALGGVMGELVTGMDTQGDRLARGLKTDLTIINDPENVATSPLVIYVKNTGSVNLMVDVTDLVFDGVPHTDLTFDVLASTDDDTWRLGEVLQITANNLAVGAGDHVVRVVAETGVEARFTFTS